MLSSKIKKIFTCESASLHHSNACTYSETSYYKDSNDTIIDVLVCSACGNIYCAECFDSENSVQTCGALVDSLQKQSVENNPLTNNPLTNNPLKNDTTQQPPNFTKCTQLFCALFDKNSHELIDASQAFCGHYSHNDDQDECFVCHENICISCRVEHLMKFYCNNCVRRCLFCAKPTEISKAQNIIRNIDNISKKLQILQNSICAKCGLPSCDDCLDYDFLCPGCSGEQSG